MGDYARRHHPQVVARQIASGIPPINSFRAEDWRQKLIALGVTPPRNATKVELYKAWRAALAALAKARGGVTLPRNATKADDPQAEPVIEALCQSLALAHDEILKLQSVPEADRANFDWPEWSHPANSIRWAEQLLGRSLNKRALLAQPTR